MKSPNIKTAKKIDASSAGFCGNRSEPTEHVKQEKNDYAENECCIAVLFCCLQRELRCRGPPLVLRFRAIRE